MIEMIQNGTLTGPMILCDLCGERITGDANVFWGKMPWKTQSPETRETSLGTAFSPIATHKECYVNRLHELGIEHFPIVHSMDLNAFLGHLLKNTKAPKAKLPRRVAA